MAGHCPSITRNASMVRKTPFSDCKTPFSDCKTPFSDVKNAVLLPLSFACAQHMGLRVVRRSYRSLRSLWKIKDNSFKVLSFISFYLLLPSFYYFRKLDYLDKNKKLQNICHCHRLLTTYWLSAIYFFVMVTDDLKTGLRPHKKSVF